MLRQTYCMPGLFVLKVLLFCLLFCKHKISSTLTVCGPDTHLYCLRSDPHQVFCFMHNTGTESLGLDTDVVFHCLYLCFKLPNREPSDGFM